VTPRDVLAALRHPFGSALREPSSGEVYEGRLPGHVRPEAVRREPAGVNFLDSAETVKRWRSTSPGTARLVVPTPPSSPSDPPSGSTAGSPVAGWAPWCPECQVPPLHQWSLGNTEYLARQHDIVWHGGAWTCQALPAGEVAELVSALPGGGR
jgi:hypothetical protein